MTLRSYLEDKRYLYPLLDALHRTDALRIVRPSPAHDADFTFDGTRLSREHLAYVSGMFAEVGRSIAACLDLFSLIHLVGDGPKVFRPTAAECFALEEVQVRIPVSAYAQPFPTFCIEFPAEYREARRTEGIGVFGGTESYGPVAQILTHLPAIGVITGATLTDSGDGAVLCGMIGSPGAATIEDDVMRRLGDNHTAAINDDELTTERRAVRVALNACLLLMDRGFRKVPHSDEAERLSRQLRSKAKTPARVLDELRARRRAIPTGYVIEQSVDVRRIIRGNVSDAVAEDATRRRVRPHWRSAHWRMQRHGVGLTQSKRVLIPHVMVNAEDFGGSNSETFVAQS